MNLFDIGLGLCLSLVLGFLAARKHRTAWEWALVSFPLLFLFGMEIFIPLLILLVWLKPICPKCHYTVAHKDIPRRRCPHCDYQGRIGIIDPIWFQLIPRPFLTRRRVPSRSQRRRGRHIS